MLTEPNGTSGSCDTARLFHIRLLSLCSRCFNTIHSPCVARAVLQLYRSDHPPAVGCSGKATDVLLSVGLALSKPGLVQALSNQGMGAGKG